MTLRALIFDVDGTLAYTERDGHRPAFNSAFVEHGLDWHWDEAFYGTLLGVAGGKERIAHYAREYDPATYARPDFDEFLQRLHETKTRYYQRLLAAGALPLRPDIGPLICEAHTEGLRLAIASSSKPENVIGLLRANLGPNADRWFDVILAGDKVKAKKPAPDIYLAVLTELDLPADDCMTIEDSANGLASSLAAGIPTVITISDYTRNECFDGARVVLSKPGELTLERMRLWHATK